MRGGVFFISKRYSKANNKYLKSYDPKSYYILRSEYFICLYNVYISTGFKWIDSKGFDSNKYTSDSSNSSVLEVDLKYPEDLCELHNDYPLAPDKIEIIREMSKYQFKNWCLTFLLKESMCFILKTYNFT